MNRNWSRENESDRREEYRRRNHAYIYKLSAPAWIGRECLSDNGLEIEAKCNYSGSPAPAFGRYRNEENFFWPVVTAHIGFQHGEHEKRDKFVMALQEFIDNYFGPE